jgi:DNA-binding transcriptional LysR family regulator
MAGGNAVQCLRRAATWQFSLREIHGSMRIECGSFRAAQSILGCRAPAISMNIKKLERKVGLVLCQRGRAGLVLTPAGKIVYDAACQLFLAVEQFERDTHRARSQTVHKLRVCLCDAIQADRDFSIVSVLSRFMDRRRDVSLSVETLPPPEIERKVVEGLCDLGITPSFYNLDGLVYEPLIEERQILVCGRGHPLFDDCPERIAPESLQRYAHFGRSYMTGPGLRSIPGKWPQESSVNSIEAAVLLIRTGHFIGYLPEHIVQEYSDDGGMREILPDRTRYVSRISVIFKKSRLSDEGRSLITELLDNRRVKSTQYDHGSTELAGEQTVLQDQRERAASVKAGHR